MTIGSLVARVREWLATSIELAKACGASVRRHPRLLVVPLLAAAMSLPVLVLFAAPVLLLQTTDPTKPGLLLWLIEEAPPSAVPLLSLVLLFYTFLVLYLLYAVIAFFNVALTHAALAAFRGEEPSLREALRHAASRISSVLAYAAIALFLGSVLGALERRLRILSRVLPFTLGLGWASLALLVLPVLVQERRGARDAVRRAAQLFRASWGEGGLATLTLWFLWLPLVGLGLGLSSMLQEDPTRFSLSGVLAAGATLLLLSLGFVLVQDRFNTLYGAALYVYAAEGVVPTEFDHVEAQTVFRIGRGQGAVDDGSTHVATGVPTSSPGPWAGWRLIASLLFVAALVV